MRLAVVLAQFPRLSETFIARELEGLRELGFDLTLYALSRPPANEAALVDDHGFEVVYRPAPITSALSSPRLVALRELIDQFVCGEGAVSVERLLDLRHVPTALAWAEDMSRRGVERVHGQFAYVPSMVALMAAAACRARFSFAAHAWDLWCTKDDALLKTLLDRADFVHVCTAYGRDFLLSRVGEAFAPKVHHVYHGLDLPDYAFAERLHSDKLTIIAVGRLVQKKGFEVLLEACRRLRSAHLDLPFECEIIGAGPLEQDLQTQLTALNLADHVKLAGPLPHGEVIQRLAHAQVCVVPSIIASDGDRDGLPNVILEAAALGVPLIATDVSAIPEFVEDRVSGRLVPPADPDALAGALADTWTDPSSPAQFAHAARQKVEGQFDLTANVRAVMALFSRFVVPPSGGPCGTRPGCGRPA